MIIVIDNYDSFTYNLVQYLGVIDSEVLVFKNDEISVSEIKKLCPRNIIISPGPGHPKDSKVSLDCINYLGGEIPILGISNRGFPNCLTLSIPKAALYPISITFFMTI